MVTKLIEGGVNPNSQSAHNNSLLHQAAEYGQIQVVKCLIDRGAQVDAKGSYDQTPFWEAILNGHLDVAQFLLDKGAEIDSGSHNGGTVLHYVCEYNTDPVPNHKLAQWLLDHGARVDAVDNRGDSPLHKSAWKGHVASATVLISAGANVNAKNKKGMTPLDHALNQQQTQIERMLRNHDARPGKSNDSN
jgi:ankyrin repeat protein